MPDEHRSTEPALAIVNARVWTGDPRRPWADAVLVRGDRIAGVGSSAEIRKRAGAGTLVVDARGMLLSTDEPDVVIAAGAPADLTVVDRTTGGGPDGTAGDVVLRLARGRVIVDRDAWIPRDA